MHLPFYSSEKRNRCMCASCRIRQKRRLTNLFQTRQNFSDNARPAKSNPVKVAPTPCSNFHRRLHPLVCPIDRVQSRLPSWKIYCLPVPLQEKYCEGWRHDKRSNHSTSCACAARRRKPRQGDGSSGEKESRTGVRGRISDRRHSSDVKHCSCLLRYHQLDLYLSIYIQQSLGPVRAIDL
jgi:hypothetical protein